jgi:hypothetical protein
MDQKLQEYERAHPEVAASFPVFGELAIKWSGDVVKATKVFNGSGAETGQWKVVLRSQSTVGIALDSTDVTFVFDPAQHTLMIENVLRINMTAQASARFLDGVQAYRARTQPARDASWNTYSDPSLYEAQYTTRKNAQGAQLYGGSLQGGSPRKKRAAGKRR